MKKVALFVGVDRYADSCIRNLNYASEDAGELASAFKLLLKFDRVEKMLNPAHAPEVLDAVKGLTRGLGDGDLFFFFFAGHGFRVKDNHVLVCASDEYAELEDEYAGLPVGRLKKRLLGPWNRMIVLDACQNDIRASRGTDAGLSDRDLALIHAPEKCSEGEGWQVVLTSCSERQQALEISELGHGLFTSALLESVTGFADGHRRLDLDTLKTDVSSRMAGLARKYCLSGKQDPLFTIPGTAHLVLLEGAPPASAARPADVAALRTELERMRAEMTRLASLAGGQPTVSSSSAPDVRKEERRAGATKTIMLPGGASMEMVWCPPGTFLMGSPAGEEGRWYDESQHRVTLTKGFWLAKTSVTQAQWKSVMENNPSSWLGDDLPVHVVSWNDCMEFCRKAGHGLQLPTEAQWEYACRAGTTGAYCWGNALNGNKARCDGNYPCGTTEKGPDPKRPAPVASYAPNSWGIYDMHGNVSEWCADWYGAYPDSVVRDPTGPASGSFHVNRGGHWSSLAGCCRSAARGFNSPDYPYSLGFRPVAVWP